MKNLSRTFAIVFLLMNILRFSGNIYSQTTTSEFEHIAAEQGGLHGSVFVVLQDSRGFMWFGTTDGLIRYDGNKFRVFKHNPDDETSISNNFVITLHEDKSGMLWIGTEGGGLNKYDKATDRFTRYIHKSNEPNSLSNNTVTTILEDESGSLWLGTYGGGLNKFDPNSQQFLRFIDQQDLLNNVIFDIVQDNNHNLWLNTGKGLSKFNTKTKIFRDYSETDKRQDYEFQEKANLERGKKGKISQKTNKFISFPPDSINDNIRIPSVVITDFQLFNKSVPVGLDTSTGRSILHKTITETDEIELTYKDYIITFEFAALDFQFPEKNKFAYMLEGFDRGWTYTDASRRSATYTNLDPGEYTFWVKGSNSDGIWNETGTSLKIIVTPPWWETWQIYLLYLIVVLSVLYGLRRYELNREMWKNQSKLDEVKLKERAEIDQMKSRFFANISHEFRTPLTLILGPLEKIKANISSREIQKQMILIQKNASRLLILVNQLLDLSKLDAGKLTLNASPGNIVLFVKGIVMFFKSLADQKDISLKVVTSNSDIQIYFDRDKMAKILNNLLSNALKFTSEGGKITVHITHAERNFVEIKIRDTGIGILKDELPRLFNRFYQVDSIKAKEHKGTGIGLALSKELVELHQGSISVRSQKEDPDHVGTGWTEFTIKLPGGKDHLKAEEIDPKQAVKEDMASAEEEDFTPWPEFSILESNELSEINDAEPGELGLNVEEDKTLILVVEDHTDLRQYIKDSLGNNFIIKEAPNGEQGVREARRLIPDIIISDIMMPKMDGNELTRILKQDEKTSHIPIILLTAKFEHESKLESLEIGADDYITKPFDHKELQLKMKNLIDMRKKFQKKYGRGDYIPRKEPRGLNNLEEKFMARVIEIIENHISEEDFNIEQFAEEMYMSRMQLHRKLRALTGKSASLYVRSFRLLRSRKMIEDGMGNISEIAYSVGFSSPAYFTRCFKKEFGVPPSEFSG
ncbi:MAG: response regulator [bacterium]|nr:MAG: response regulator [bacterium]